MALFQRAGIQLPVQVGHNRGIVCHRSGDPDAGIGRHRAAGAEKHGQYVVKAAEAAVLEAFFPDGLAALDKLSAFVVGQKVFGQGSGALVQKDGTLIAYTDKNYVLKGNLLSGRDFNASVHAFAAKALNGETGFADYVNNGERRRVFYAPAGHDFFFIIFFPISVIEAMVRGLTIFLIVIAAAAFLVIGFLIFAIMRSLSHSLKGMSAATVDLSKGDLTVRFNGSGHDELAVMSRELNAMLSSVSETLHNIRTEADETSKQADTLAALSEETLASMEEVAASIERVNGVVNSASSATEETHASIGEIAEQSVWAAVFIMTACPS